jgi:hypothetical protein
MTWRQRLACWSYRAQERLADRLPRRWSCRVDPFCRGMNRYVDQQEAAQRWTEAWR